MYQPYGQLELLSLVFIRNFWFRGEENASKTIEFLQRNFKTFKKVFRIIFKHFLLITLPYMKMPFLF